MRPWHNRHPLSATGHPNRSRRLTCPGRHAIVWLVSFSPVEFAAAVAQMRALGVTRLKTDNFEAELGDPPLPPPPVVAAETEEQRQNREQAELDRDMFASAGGN